MLALYAHKNTHITHTNTQAQSSIYTLNKMTYKYSDAIIFVVLVYLVSHIYIL